MPEGFGAGIGIVGSEPTQRREHKDGGGPGSEMQPGRGWASAGPPPRGAQGVGGLRWGAMAWSWHGQIVGAQSSGLDFAEKLFLIWWEAVSLSSALGSASCGWAGAGFCEGWAPRADGAAVI